MKSTLWVLVCSLAISGAAGAQTDAGATVRGVLRALAESHGFAVEGLEKIGDERAPLATGNPARVIERLLGDYNYVLVGKPGGGVERILVLGRISATPEQPESTIIETTRYGAHHMVTASLVGPGGARVSAPLMIDTGASTVVLPKSMIERLGFDARDLTDGMMQTANRQVAGKKGMLSSVELGGAVLNDVAVAFIDDDRLGGKMLLGMSFLGRYRLTIDDLNDQITLIRDR